MALASLEISVLAFRPERDQHFLNDTNDGDVHLFYGHVVCSECACHVDVSAPAEGSSGFCPNCGQHIQVAPLHLRLDDSRPDQVRNRGCSCGDPLCRAWGAS